MIKINQHSGLEGNQKDISDTEQDANQQSRLIATTTRKYDKYTQDDTTIELEKSQPTQEVDAEPDKKQHIECKEGRKLQQ